jgi:hypothetical protein
MDKLPPNYFTLCGVGGFLSCGATHYLMTPIDLAKCNAQANPGTFPNSGSAMTAIYSGKAEPLGMLRHQYLLSNYL